MVVFINTQTHKERIKEQLVNIGYWFCKHIILFFCVYRFYSLSYVQFH